MRILATLAALWIASWLTLGAAEAAPSAQVRYAVIVGADEGLADEAPLRFAERDASRLSDVLARFGQIPDENMLLLRGRTAEDVEHVLGEVAGRLAADAEAGRDSLLLFFYSGHADANDLHLYGTRLPLSRLKALVSQSQASLQVMVVDACRSGALTRIKGATPAAPFAIGADDRLDAEGLAIITSSSAGEDAQESDQIQGGIFTHHFIGGLLGAADASADQRVTLNEAYRYAYDQTLRATSKARFVQHPTYSFRMRGRDDLVLTRLTETRGLGRIGLQLAGRYLLLPQRREGPVVELSAEGQTHVLLEPGRWLVRRRTDEAVYEGHAEVRSGALEEIGADRLQAVPFGQTVRRGDALSRRSAWLVSAGAEISGAYQQGLPATLGPTLGARVDLAPLSLGLRLRWGRARADNEDLSLIQDTLGADLTALKLYDLAGDVAAGFGVRAGGDMIWQRFDTSGQGPTRTAFAGRASPLVRLEWSPAAWLVAGVEAGAEMIWVPRAEARSFNAVPTVALSFGGYLP